MLIKKNMNTSLLKAHKFKNTSMKKISILFAVIISLVSCSFKQPESKAEFKFEKETHNFGQIRQGQPVTINFTFTNIGSEPLIISSVDSSCDCIKTGYTREPILKGEKGIVTITYDAAAVQAGFTKAVIVKSNARTPVKMLYVKGEVQSPG